LLPGRLREFAGGFASRAGLMMPDQCLHKSKV
jgi:hypothetical protein